MLLVHPRRWEWWWWFQGTASANERRRRQRATLRMNEFWRWGSWNFFLGLALSSSTSSVVVSSCFAASHEDAELCRREFVPSRLLLQKTYTEDSWLLFMPLLLILGAVPSSHPWPRHHHYYPNNSIYAQSLWARKRKYYNEITLTYHNEIPVVLASFELSVLRWVGGSWGIVRTPLFSISIRVQLICVPHIFKDTYLDRYPFLVIIIVTLHNVSGLMWSNQKGNNNPDHFPPTLA